MIEKLRRLASIILDPDRPPYSLRPEVVELTALLADSQPARPAVHQDISAGETQTPDGLALSATMAAMCADDFVRTITFIRGSHAAIVDLRLRFPDRPIRVLYVGCGPLATLAIPLMASFAPSEARFTLIDLHAESIESAANLIDALGLDESATELLTLDAGTYRIDPDHSPDIILIEIMQACLESEPQVALSRRLLQQVPGAILVPEEVSVDLVLVDPSTEFNLGDPDSAGIRRDRIPVGQVFVLNRETMASWERISADRLPAAALRIPDFDKQRYQPMLFTSIRVYQDLWLRDYDSGLTCPRPLPAFGSVDCGDTIHFYYQLGPRPGLRIEENCRSNRGSPASKRNAEAKGDK